MAPSNSEAEMKKKLFFAVLLSGLGPMALNAWWFDSTPKRIIHPCHTCKSPVPSPTPSPSPSMTATQTPGRG
jgi:hypothetical protein